MSYPSYPPPKASELHTSVEITPRSLKPLSIPPLPNTLPPLPSAPRNPSFASNYTLTTHLYPSAYPHAPSTPLPRSAYANRPNETKEERVTRQRALVDELFEINKAQHAGLIPQKANPDVFWSVINRFVRKDAGQRRNRITLFLAHANGFPKETWEPALLQLFSRIEGTGIVIDEVWAFEAIQHGDSALINEHILGDVFDWDDNARDVLNFLLYYLPSRASSASLPTHLPRIEEEEAKRRRTFGYKYLPALFSSLILVDPILVPLWAPTALLTKEDIVNKSLPLMAAQRRSTWNSRQEAASGFKKSPFFTSWDPAVLDTYIQHAIAPNPAGPDGSVMLKMSGECIVFLDRSPSQETWLLLPRLDPRIDLFFILSGKDTYAVGGERAVRETAWRRPGKVSNVILPVGHLVSEALEITMDSKLKYIFCRFRKRLQKHLVCSPYLCRREAKFCILIC
ncbi:hypothetical protein M422DRAFT_160172 [Sphaerobolus stellatus SS14]|nr:hypothetical protein M422DRAFT_160172 [Sphaerobolus stellatus SS14]